MGFFCVAKNVSGTGRNKELGDFLGIDEKGGGEPGDGTFRVLAKYYA